MFHLSRFVRLLALSLLASLVPIGAARADHFKFIVIFTSGTLNGSFYTGYFTTDLPVGDFTPIATHEQLISLAITIDGAKFIMQDDVDFPNYPRVRMGSTKPQSFDFIARSATALHDKFVWMFRRSNPENEVRFGTWVRGKEAVESRGVIYDIYRIDPREAPPEPQCLPCHSQMNR